VNLEQPIIEKRWLRNTTLGSIVLPPIASIAGSITGLWSVEQSILIIVSASLLLLPLIVNLVVKVLRTQQHVPKIFKSDYESIPYLENYVDIERPKTADLLEYSGLGAMPLLVKLSGSTSVRKIRLLVSHPDSAVNDYQRNRRLAEGLVYLAHRIDIDRAKEIGLEVGCYRQSASIRGRLLGNEYLVMGWYSHERRASGNPGEAHIWGGSNSLVGVHSRDTESKALAETFQTVFESLWNDAEPPELAWNRYRQHVQLPTPAWMNTVAPK
jgi:hypothetical protein